MPLFHKPFALMGAAGLMGLALPFAATAEVSWQHCANEGQVCSFSGLRNVRYGAQGVFVYRTASGPLACTNATWGDPLRGTAKACDLSDFPSTPQQVWTRCATEGQTCAVDGAFHVRYGADGHFAYQIATGPLSCGNTVFGDPVPGTLKACDTSPVVDTPAAPAARRDALKWPFAATSIWNMPIGSGAQYVAANLPAVPGGDVWSPMPQVDDERIVLRPWATVTPVYQSSAGWTGADRCAPTGPVLASLPMPSDFVVSNNNANGSAVLLKPDGRTLVHTQPFTRCNAGGPATSLVVFPPVDLYGDGMAGSHGGSGLSALGGSLRVGELRPGASPPRHALKVNVYTKQVLYRCTRFADCYRWPATSADGYAVGFYGTAGNNANTQMKMGALLAIPASTDLSRLGLETEPARQLAWTLQNYGAYIVDDTWGPSFSLNAENGPDGSLRTQFQADWGYPLEQRVNDNSPWSRDMQRLAQALSVVANNAPDRIGGGGTPRQPLAPPF